MSEGSEPLSEIEKVELWRLEVLVSAGYPVGMAELIAQTHHADLHRAVELLVAGCRPVVAALILL
jgi:hypothetical protein